MHTFRQKYIYTYTWSDIKTLAYQLCHRPIFGRTELRAKWEQTTTFMRQCAEWYPSVYFSNCKLYGFLSRVWYCLRFCHAQEVGSWHEIFALNLRRLLQRYRICFGKITATGKWVVCNVLCDMKVLNAQEHIWKSELSGRPTMVDKPKMWSQLIKFCMRIVKGQSATLQWSWYVAWVRAGNPSDWIKHGACLSQGCPLSSDPLRRKNTRSKFV